MAKKDDAQVPKKPNRYSAIIGTIFKNHYNPGKTQFEFSRDEFVEIARSLKIALPKNLGDTIYSFRFRTVLPDEIVATAGKDREGLSNWRAAPSIVSGLRNSRTSSRTRA